MVSVNLTAFRRLWVDRHPTGTESENGWSMNWPRARTLERGGNRIAAASAAAAENWQPRVSQGNLSYSARPPPLVTLANPICPAREPAIAEVSWRRRSPGFRVGTAHEESTAGDKRVE